MIKKLPSLNKPTEFDKTQGAVSLVRYHTMQGVRVAFVKKGRKFYHVVEFDSPINVRKVPVSDDRYMTPLTDVDGQYYPYVRAVKKFMLAAKTHGITEAAKKILDTARKAGRREINLQPGETIETYK